MDAVEEAERIETTPWPYHFFSALDFSMGLMLGFYNPVQKRWRNWDCRSQFFGMALSYLNYTKYFDKPFEPSTGAYIGSAVQLLFTYMGTRGMINTCNAQIQAIDGTDNKWPDWFGLNDNEDAKSSNPAG